MRLNTSAVNWRLSFTVQMRFKSKQHGTFVRDSSKRDFEVFGSRVECRQPRHCRFLEGTYGEAFSLSREPEWNAVLAWGWKGKVISVRMSTGGHRWGEQVEVEKRLNTSVQSKSWLSRRDVSSSRAFHGEFMKWRDCYSNSTMNYRSFSLPLSHTH